MTMTGRKRKTMTFLGDWNKKEQKTTLEELEKLILGIEEQKKLEEEHEILRFKDKKE